MSLSEIESISNIVTSFIELSKEAINLPQNERKQYRDAVDETFAILDSAISTVINRLGTILSFGPLERQRFIDELYRLNDFRQWEEIERKVFLCYPLRSAHGEMYALKNRVKDRISLGNKDKLNQLIEEILVGERVLGTFIGKSLSNISNMADKASQSEIGYNEARKAVSQMRDTLRSDRHRLIEAEIMFYDSISPKSSKIKDEAKGAKEKPWFRRLLSRF